MSGTGVGSQPAVIFKNTSPISAGAGTFNIAFQSANAGPYTAATGSLTVLVSPPTGFTSATNAAAAVPGSYSSDANTSTAKDCYLRANGKWGIYIDGPDSNACSFFNITVVANGVRALTGADGHPDGGGIWDSCFIGNTWVQCHAATNTGYAYRADGTGESSVFVGCYQESGQVSRVKAPSIVIGGSLTNESGTQLVGLTGATNGIAFRGAENHYAGSASPDGLTRVDMSGGDELMRIHCTEDSTDYFWVLNVSGPVAHTYSWQHANAANRAAFGMTNAAHTYGPGQFFAYNGILLGSSIKLHGGLNAAPPAQAHSTPGSPTVVDSWYDVGAFFTDGRRWYGVQARDGSNNLTWQFVASRGADTTSVTATPYAALLTDSILQVNVSGPATINLPAPSTKYKLLVKDVSGNATTNNITLHRSGTEKIDGVAADKVMSTNYGALELWSDGTNIWTK